MLHLAQSPHHNAPSIRIHQQVDDVGPALAVPIAVTHQHRGDRVAVGVVTDQDVAQVLASRWVED
jgi:hypothetical protein